MNVSIFLLYATMQLKASSSPLCGIRLQMPSLPRPMKNPIGAGDAVSSGTLLRWTGASTSKETPAKVFLHFIFLHFKVFPFRGYYILFIIAYIFILLTYDRMLSFFISML